MSFEILEMFSNLDRIETKNKPKIDSLIKATKELIELSKKKNDLMIILIQSSLHKYIELEKNEILLFNPETFEYSIISNSSFQDKKTKFSYQKKLEKLIIIKQKI